jgi:hypothetical protein
LTQKTDAEIQKQKVAEVEDREKESQGNMDKLQNNLPTLIKKSKELMKKGLKEKKFDNAKILEILNKYDLQTPDSIPDATTAKMILEDFEKLVKAN